MQRTLIVSVVVGWALTLGCTHRFQNEYHGEYKDYYERHIRDRYMDGLGGRLDVNRASTRELEDLPTVSRHDAERILENRPYASTRELLDRHIIEARQYDLIEHFIKVCYPCRAPEVVDCPCAAPVPAPVVERRG
jgi:hypothetical protein